MKWQGRYVEAACLAALSADAQGNALQMAGHVRSCAVVAALSADKQGIAFQIDISAALTADAQLNELQMVEQECNKWAV